MDGSATSVFKGNGVFSQINTIAINNTTSKTVAYRLSSTNSSILQGLELKTPDNNYN